MKVSIPVKKTVTETVELPQLPYYSTRYGALFYMITEEQNVIHVANRQITFWSPKDTHYSDNLAEAYQGEECSKEEFDNMVTATMKRINIVLNPPADSPALNTMNNFDPNEQKQQAEEVKAEGQEVAAVEQDAQEKALESAEEGGTEG